MLQENEFIKRELLKIILEKNRIPKKIIYCRNGKSQKLCLSIPQAGEFLDLTSLTISTYLSRGIYTATSKIFRLIDGKGYLRLILKERLK